MTLPTGRWFVVDSFARGPKGSARGSATQVFCEHFGLDPNQCLFVMLSHFHQDHYSGIPPLVKALRLEQPKLRFAALGLYRRRAVQAQLQEALLDQVDHLQSVKIKRVLREQYGYGGGMGATINEVYQLCEDGFRDTMRWDNLSSHDSQIELLVVMPSEELVNRVLRRDEIGRLTELMEEEGISEDEILRRAERRHVLLNNLSLGVFIGWGENGILLTGDAEKEAWAAFSQDSEPPADIPRSGSPASEVTMLKMPHHGSSRTWNSTLEACLRGTSIAVSSHNCHGDSYVLPDAKGIGLVLEQGVALAVPAASNLPAGAPALNRRKGWNLRLERLPPIELRKRGKQHRARRLSKLFPQPVRAGERRDTELNWVSVVYDRGGEVAGLFGGSDAAVLEP